MRGIVRIAAILVAFGLLSHGARASQREAVLGANGELYTVRAGTYGELFPGQMNVPASNQVLALDIEKPDTDRIRLVVRGTEGPDVDSTPFLLYEEASNTLYLVWEMRLGGVFPILMLTGYKDSWIAPYTIIDYPFSLKTSPQLAVTHDSYQEEAETEGEPPVTRQVTVLHLAWAQEGEAGGVETFYTPVFLENGHFLGRSPSYRLDDFGPPDAALSLADTAGTAGTTTTIPQLTLQRGRDEQTVVAAFASGGRLMTLEIGALQPQLGRIADGARSHIIDWGAKLTPSRLPSLAKEVKAEIIRLGRSSFDPTVLEALATQVESYVAAEIPKSSIKVIADGARSHIIDWGARLTGRGMRNAQSASVTDIFEVNPIELDAGADSGLPSQ
ncbi:MAG TPA: hypothetical protein VH394_14575, partial [Thermoanaerobaculia bacterium]|nr:hypothetical protein [Thermoanaerobaculia bacterium]